jgi:glycosyltransferase involved in cell wall biosynthesis
MKKLLYLTNGINGSGGLERVLAIKASYLAENYNYEIHIIVLNNGHVNPFYEFSNKITFHSIDVSGNPLHYFLKYRKGIKQIVKNVKPDIISVCDDGLKGILFPIIFGKKIPVIYERHASFNIFIKKDRRAILNRFILNVKKRIMKFGAKKFDKFIVLTNGNLDEWQIANMKVIPNPLSFFPKENAKLTNKKIISVGSHNYNKGFDRLIKAWKIIHQKNNEWKLDIYGKNNNNFDLSKMIKKMELENSITLHEPTKDILNKYMESSIYVLPSRSEGFGMVLIEAMACGVPCIAFDCPSGPKDIINNDEDGILIENGNLDAFSNAIINLISNEDKRKLLGKKARENVKRYHIENIAPVWDKLFNEIINK